MFHRQLSFLPTLRKTFETRTTLLPRFQGHTLLGYGAHLRGAPPPIVTSVAAIDLCWLMDFVGIIWDYTTHHLLGDFIVESKNEGYLKTKHYFME